MKFLIVLLVLSAFAVGATWVRYDSFDPCAWMYKDMVESSNLPGFIVAARIEAASLLSGVTSRTPKQCLYAWWHHRFEGAQSDGVKAPALKKIDKK